MANLNLLRHTTIPWKAPAGEVYESFVVKKGHNRYGELRRYRLTGKLIYWAQRKSDEIHQATQSWAIDVETINALKTRKVPVVGVEVDNGDLYVTPIESFRTEKQGGTAIILNYTLRMGAKGKRGALQWFVPLTQWKCHRAPPGGTLELMRIAGR